MKQLRSELKQIILPGILHSYSIVFFARDKWIGALLLLVSLFNPAAGFAGFISVTIAITVAYVLGFNREMIRDGLYGFNALLVGIGLGTFFQTSLVFFIVLGFASLLAIIFTIAFAGWLSKYNLPFLSIPFIVTFWLLLLSSREFSQLGLSERNIYWMNEMVAVGGKPLFHFVDWFQNIPLPFLLNSYLRSLSAIFFQDNILTGSVIAFCILIHSRIGFSLSLLGFLSAYLFYTLTGADVAEISHYNLGANFVMAAMAIGGFFLIPSYRSYLWVILLTPLITFIVLGLTALLHPYQLPLYSLPFSLVVMLFLFFLSFRVKANNLHITPVQHFSPEINLYKFRNNSERLRDGYYLPISFPFWGEWNISQGHDGNITHKGDWSKALDFVVQDAEENTYDNRGIYFENYYCYNKPVLAVADGVVEEIIDQIPDNAIGRVNVSQNWGNTIVIKHLNGLYSKISHLKPGSFRVIKGEHVVKGQWLATVGNSGRSPEPHIHFQLQSTPYIGSRTLSYPIGYFVSHDRKGYRLRSYEVPEEGELVSNVISTPIIQNAFLFQPGTKHKFQYKINDGEEISETWESYTDAYNNRYLLSEETGSVAYFINNGTLFYFTHYHGNKKDLLYYFYRGAYKVLLGYYHEMPVTDYFPLNEDRGRAGVWLQDFLAPFRIFMRSKFTMIAKEIDDYYQPENIILQSEIGFESGKKYRSAAVCTLQLLNNRVSKIKFEQEGKVITAVCVIS